MMEVSQSLECEREVLAAVFISPTSLRLIRAEGLERDDFCAARHRLWWDALTTVEDDADSVLDEVTLRDWMTTHGTWEQAGGAAALLALMDRSGSSAHGHVYARKMRGYSRARAIGAAARVLADSVVSGDYGSIDELAASAVASMQTAAAHAAPMSGVHVGAEAAHAAFAPHPAGRSLDTDLGISLPRGGDGYTIICARPSMGKSALALSNVVWPELLRGGTGIYVSVEMDNAVLRRRLVSRLTGVPIQDVDAFCDLGVMPSGDAGSLTEAINRVCEVTADALTVVDGARSSAAAIVGHVDRHIQRCGGVSCVVVDHMQIIDHGRRGAERMDEAMKRMSDTFRVLQKETGAAVVVLSQLNRSIDARAVPMPKLSDLRECGAMEEDAGMVLGIYRPWVYDPTEDPTTALMPVLKYRKGALGVRTLAWDGRRMAFSEGM